MIFFTLAVLEFGGLFWYGRFRAQAHDQKRKQDLSILADGLEKYYADRGLFPVSQLENTNSKNSVLRKEVKKYLDDFPDDPFSPRFFYVYKGNENQYELTAFLENHRDPDGKKSKDGKFWVYQINSEKNPETVSKKIQDRQEKNLTGNESDIYENETDEENANEQNDIKLKTKRKKTAGKNGVNEDDDDYARFSADEERLSEEIDETQELSSPDTPPSFPTIDPSLTNE